ncbi:ClpXP protease specificity-enhancing factor SspB [Rhodoblastus sp.]|uniref:SspB family protein n=1 Tax=Rhodoblastus sp. TaxID=1962975 RepID=UPI003F98BC16
MPNDLIRYDLQVQDALRGVVRKVLADAAREGLPGEHHFYITFRTQGPGVKLSARLREQYPNEMTIILQFQFWDLQVDEESFDVGLHFKNIPERLHIPFDAITGFYDPSVQFGLKFEVSEDNDDENLFGEEADEGEATAPGAVANLPRPAPEAEKARPAPEAEKAKPRGAGSEPAVVPAKTTAAEPARLKAGKAQNGKAQNGKTKDETAKDEKTAKSADAKTADEKSAPAADGESKVISFDAFRKKT